MSESETKQAEDWLNEQRRKYAAGFRMFAASKEMMRILKELAKERNAATDNLVDPGDDLLFRGIKISLIE